MMGACYIYFEVGTFTLATVMVNEHVYILYLYCKIPITCP